jgi:hypothetical protein
MIDGTLIESSTDMLAARLARVIAAFARQLAVAKGLIPVEAEYIFCGRPDDDQGCRASA